MTMVSGIELRVRSIRGGARILGIVVTLVATALVNTALAESATDNTKADDLQEIIVTGTKRDEKYLDVPVTEQVFTSAEIEKAGISRPTDFLFLTPNVTWLQSGNQGEGFVNIRGQASVRNSESAVAVVIDGVQLSTLNEFNGEYDDLQQIEVLKGPESAIYGRDAAAGAIIITTRPPTDEFQGEVKADYGNWKTAKLSAGFGEAIIPDELRYRASFNFDKTDGPFTDEVTGEKVERLSDYTGRLRFDFTPTDNLKFDYRIGGSHTEAGAIAFNAEVVGATVGGVYVPSINSNDTSLPWISDVPSSDLQDKFNTSLKVDWKLDIGTLTSISAWNYITENYQAANFPYADYNYPDTNFGAFQAAFGSLTQKYRIANTAFSQEFRLTSPSEQRLRWQGGLYFLDSARQYTTIQGKNLQSVILPQIGINGPDSVNPTTTFDDSHYTARNYAPFGNIQFDILDPLELDVAARYDTERRTVRSEAPNIVNPFTTVNPLTGSQSYNLCVYWTGESPANCHEEKTFSQLEPKVTLTWKFHDIGSVFADYGKGFKSGGFNPIGTRATLLASAPNPAAVIVQDFYGKETSDSEEIGFKSQWFQRRLTFNGAAFATDVRNAEQFEFFPTAGIQAISQIDKVKIRGWEAEGTYVIIDGVTFYAGYGATDAHIAALAANPSYVGNRSPYTADYNADAGFDIVRPIADSVQATARIDYTRTGNVWFDASNLPGSRRNPVDLVNARVGLAGNDKWSATLWSKNLTDKKYNSEAVPLLAVLNAVTRAPTRSYGVEFARKFK